MHLRFLKVFCDVVQLQSVSRAADANGISQSTASQMVRQLEQRLGVPLIDGKRRPLVVTPEGRQFYQGCRKLIPRYFALEEEVRSLHAAAAGQVSVAAIYSVGLSHLNACVKQFLSGNPQADVRVEYQHPDEVYQRVEKGHVHLGLVSYPKSTRKIRALAWRVEPMVCVCAPEHALARRTAVSWSDLDGLPMIGFVDGLRIRREIDRTLARNGVAPRLVMQFDNIETIKRAIEIDAGIGLLPAPTIEREVAAGTLVSRPFGAHAMERPLGIIHRRGQELTTSVRRFVRLLMKKPAESPAVPPAHVVTA